MIRLHAVVEGAEETFVNDVLGPEFGARGIFIDAHMITTGRRRSRKFRGGIRAYAQLKNDLTLWMKQDQQVDSWFTTLMDLYRLPSDFPGFIDCRTSADPIRRAQCLEEHLGRDLPHPRFVPYIQACEFEALLFSDVEKFDIAFPHRQEIVNQLGDIRNQFASPEHINDRPDLSPANRILELLPDYRKATAGPLIIQHIGLAKLRKECIHFGSWIARIESLV